MKTDTGSRQIVGENIKQARIHAALTQQQLADRLELSQQTVQKYERGGISLSTDRISQIAQILGCEVTTLIKSTPRQRSSAPAGRSRILSSFDHEVLDIITSISDLKTKRLALQLLRALASIKR